MLDRRYEITSVENNETYTGFARGAKTICTDPIAGTKGCATFEANNDGKVTITLAVKTGFITLFERVFSIDSDKKFTFKSDDGRFSLVIEIKNFEIVENNINFNVSLKFCLSTFCTGEITAEFSLPIPFDRIDPNKHLQQTDDLLLQILLANWQETNKCNCQ
ncbi:hypothetical protein KORDIASMS9_03774 [Kordia sp. SMS9]|uniref:hypothetical protein n=1 Tax=Kordia sp. SMS9 TaxID=2282170 RepID=UPI000E0CF841|nr:hypothetical protein [Kordia sp. SMS9]AXG71517.1 hypothetical protein KORDIASMS9_03774 [Kordia sp. SMS9]